MYLCQGVFSDPVHRNFRIFTLEHAFNTKTLQKLLPYPGTALPKHAAKWNACCEQAYSKVVFIFFSSWFASPCGPRPPRYWGSATTLIIRHATLCGTPLDECSARRRDLLPNAQHFHEAHIHVPCGIRTHNSRKQSATDPRLIPHDHPDRHRLY